MAADPLSEAAIDEVFNVDTSGDEDPFNDKPSRPGRDDKTTLNPRLGKRKTRDADLGLDEEVKITKKRRPVAKLDEARLLSEAGIPKLRALARSGKISKKLRLKGKGHEFSDVARLLNHYQLWLDNLYPRAKFADGLQLVEKVGHSRRMQVMRKEWIDEGKPGYAREKAKKKQEGEEKELDDLYAGDETVGLGGEQSASNATDADGDALFIPDSRPTENNQDENDLPEDDELEALLTEQDARPPSHLPSASKTALDNDSEGEDDLDALLAEQETRRAPPNTSGSSSAPIPSSKPQASPLIEDEEDMDDLDALLAEQETRSKPSSTAQSTFDNATTRSAKRPTILDDEEDLLNDDDDLDALIADQEAKTRVESSATVRAVTPPAAEPGRAEPDEAGDDMFSSSPVRNTAPFRSTEDHDSSQLQPAEADAFTPTQLHAGTEMEKENDGRGGGTETEADEGQEEEEGQGIANMFDSSPLQNE